MQPYNLIKLKCFIIRLMAGSALLVIAVSIIVSIVQEILGSYDAGSRIAYGLGLFICALMVILGLMFIYQAFHFERFVFGRNKRNYQLLKKDLETGEVVSAGNLVVTKDIILLFSMHFYRMCRVIRTDDIIACFENPIYGTVDKPTEYTIYLYDNKFKLHTIVMNAGRSESGHLAKEKICELKPWIFSAERDVFMDRILTKTGRRHVLKQIEKNRYDIQSTRDVEKEAETELDQLATEAKEKLDFKSILGRAGTKKDEKPKERE